jgi:hypothetical protein
MILTARFASRGIVTVALGVALTACAPGTPSTSPSVVSTNTPTVAGPLTPSQSQTPTPSISAEEAAVRKLIGETMYATQDAVASDYSIPLDTLHQVMSGALVDQRLQVYFKYRGASYKQTGRISSEVRSVTSAASGAHVVRACVDTSAMGLVDKTGKSMKSTASPPRVLHEFEVIYDRGAYKATSDTPVAATC